MARKKIHPAQLSIDFDAPIVLNITRQAQTAKVRARTAIYHPESSQLEKSRYSLKFSISGRSYEVKGTYHIVEFSASMDDSLARVVDYTHIDKIFTYRNGAYAHMPVVKTDELYLIHAVKEALTDAYTNPFLSQHTPREVGV
jgi:hypothetical protein